MIQAGILRDVISIQKKVQHLDSAGQLDTAYEDLYTDIRAKVYPLSGREYISAQQVAIETTTRVTIRFVRGIDATCRVVRTLIDEQPPIVEVYDILAVLPDAVSGRRYINLMCALRVADGWRRGDDVDKDTRVFVVDNPDLNVEDPSWHVDSN
jgi:SPP1 family predicted phage head-tail adaptor